MRKVAPAAAALTRVLEHAARGVWRREGKDFVDLTATAGVWKSDAWDYHAFERRGRGQRMWLKDAINEAMRVPSAVKCIEDKTDDGQTRFLAWSTISQIWAQKELWKD
jgi:hypothetical protein